MARDARWKNHLLMVSGKGNLGKLHAHKTYTIISMLLHLLTGYKEMASKKTAYRVRLKMNDTIAVMRLVAYVQR